MWFLQLEYTNTKCIMVTSYILSQRIENSYYLFFFLKSTYTSLKLLPPGQCVSQTTNCVNVPPKDKNTLYKIIKVLKIILKKTKIKKPVSKFGSFFFVFLFRFFIYFFHFKIFIVYISLHV
jgi:hypothetical protein